MIEIIQTNPGQEHFQRFIDLPKSLYPTDSVRFKLPESIPTDFLKACYMLLDQGKIVARASLYNHPMLRYDGLKAFSAGNYECVDHQTYSLDLLGHLAGEAKKNGAQFLIGPMNGSTWENYRFSTEHLNPPFFLEPYHHLYYNTHFLQAGFDQIATYYTNADTHIKYDDPAVLQREKELMLQGVTIRPIDLDAYETEIERIYHFTAIAFKTNFLYTPISKEAFLRKYLPAKNIIHPELTLIAEGENQNLLGYFFCTDDFLNRTAKSLIVKTLARHPDPEWRGLGHVIGNAIYRKAAVLHYENIIHPFIYQQGTSTRLSLHFSGENYRNYALYGKKTDQVSTLIQHD